MPPEGVVGSVLWNDARRHPLQLALTLGSMATGIAVIVAIWLASEAARTSFRSTVEGLAGRATHQLVADAGIDPARLPVFRTHPKVRAAMPIIEVLLPVAGRIRADGVFDAAPLPPLRLLGVDPFQLAAFARGGPDASPLAGKDLKAFLSVPGGVVLSETWLREATWQAGQGLRLVAGGRPVDLQVLGAYAAGGFGLGNANVALCDLATAQEISGRLERIDRIDLIVKAGGEAALEALLQPGERLERPSTRGQRTARLLDAFRLNLLALGALALLVGAFMVFNAAEFSVIRRRPLLGQLRCLGVSRRVLLGACLAECAVLGLLGGLLGLVAGRGLAHYLVDDLARTVTALYGFVDVRLLEAQPYHLVAILLLGPLVALAAGLFPALDAAGTHPRQALLQQQAEDRFARHQRRLAWAGLGALLAAAAALLLPTRALWPGYIAAFAWLGGGAALLPLAMRAVLPTLSRLAQSRSHLLVPLAADRVAAALSRTGPAAAALAAALGMALGVLAMVSSFEAEVRGWIDATLVADIYVSSQSHGLDRDAAGVAAAALSRLQGHPDVATAETLRGLDVLFGTETVFVAGVSPRAPGRGPVPLLEGRNEGLAERLYEGQTLISEPLARHRGLGVGDRIELPTRQGPVVFEIAGVFRDFSTDRGYMMLADSVFVACFGDPGVRSVALYLRPGADAASVATALRRQVAGDFLLDITANAALRRHVIQVFDQTFAITFVLAALAILLALTGVATTLLALVLEHRAEVALLRALGARLPTVFGLFSLQALLIAAFAVGAAVPLGMGLSRLLIDVINLRAFGWSIAPLWPWGAVAAVCAAPLAAALLVGLAPLAAVRRISLTAALRSA